MAFKGLYGCPQGNENRGSMAVLDEKISDNALIEGEAVSVLHRMAVERVWAKFDAYTKELKANGFAQYRIDAMIARAMYGVKLT